MELIGKMDRRFTLQLWSQSRDSAGGITETWEDVATFWGSFQEEQMAGTEEKYHADRLSQTDKVVVITRHRNTGKVNEKRRLKYRNLYFDVLQVKEHESKGRIQRKGYIEIICERKK